MLPALVAAGTPAIRHTTFDYGADRVEVSIKPAAGVDALYAPRRTVLDAALVAAAENAGATFDFGARVTGLHRSTTGHVDGVVVTTRQGTSHVVSAGFVIGADGRGSLVAQEAGATATVVGRNAGAYLYGYWSGLPTAGYEWLYRPGLSAGLIPTGGGLTCVFVGGAPEDVAGAAAAHGGSAPGYSWLAGRLGLAERLEAATRVESVRFARALPPAYLRRPHGQGWALVGDAGHWLDPMSTHGMTSALRDADLLSRALIDTAPASPARRHALHEYGRIRDRCSLPMLLASDEIAGHRWDLHGIRPLLRTMASAMADEVDMLEGQRAA